MVTLCVVCRSVIGDSLDLEQEVDPLNVDHFSCTPLVSPYLTHMEAVRASPWLPWYDSVFQMWACALGHQRAAELLYRWNSRALGIPDSLGRLPLAVARSRGHTRLAAALEELHTQRAQLAPREDTLPSPLSTSPDTGNILPSPDLRPAL